MESKYKLHFEEQRELKRQLKLSGQQVQELQVLIKRCLGKELSTEESVKLFDTNVETFINTLNDIVIHLNQEKIAAT